MRIITWNMRRAKSTSPSWEYLLSLDPDIALLQDVAGILDSVKEKYSVLSKIAISKNGNPQKFSTVVITKGKIVGEIKLRSDLDWVNRELEFFKGNFVGGIVKLKNMDSINVVSIYSPAWPVNKARLAGIDATGVKLTLNPKVWGSEIIWSALKKTMKKNEEWVVGGDYNSSETFDLSYQLEHGLKGGIVSNGNKEIRERMYALGFKECLREFSGRLIPTYRHTDKIIMHQLDHLYVTNDLYKKIKDCKVGESSIFEKRLSDHLPIIAEFV